MISLFGWILAMRGVALMAAPDLYEHAAYVYGRDISCAAHFRGPSIISYANITPLIRQGRADLPKVFNFETAGRAQYRITHASGKSV